MATRISIFNEIELALLKTLVELHCTDPHGNARRRIFKAVDIETLLKKLTRAS
jgi:hypothetical protein